MKKKIMLTAMVIFSTIIISACQSEQSPQQAGEEQIKDRTGQVIEVPKTIETIVSLAPSITQVLEAFEVESKLVAVDSFTASTSDTLMHLPQIDMMAPNMEVLLALEPDVVFASEISFGMNETIFQPLKDFGIPVVLIPTSTSIQQIKEDTQFIADVLNLSEKGAALNKEMEHIIHTIAAIGQTVEPKTVLFEVSPLPQIYSFGQDVFLNEMLEIIGAQNILTNETGWLPVTEEVILDLNPDVILTNANFLDDPVGEIMKRQAWEGVTAIKNEAVFYIDNESSSTPNHRITKALIQMAQAIYPEAFATLEEQLMTS